MGRDERQDYHNAVDSGLYIPSIMHWPDMYGGRPIKRHPQISEIFLTGMHAS